MKYKNKVIVFIISSLICFSIINAPDIYYKLSGVLRNNNSTYEFYNIDKEDWNLLLVNKNNPIPSDYKINTVTLSNGQQVDERIYPSLQSMFDDMRSDGVYPVVASGYRTHEKQQQIMNEKIKEYQNEGYSYQKAKSKAEEWVAIPGTSEHQLGLAVDINADGIHSAGYEVYDWLAENAHKYGFIKRYSEDKINITGISNEPWHYRYVGIEVATEIKNNGICLEEYLKDYSKS